MVGRTTPFYVNYYTRRPIAGGHLYWHTQWRGPDEESGIARTASASISSVHRLEDRYAPG
jgi:hypothetical protein